MLNSPDCPFLILIQTEKFGHLVPVPLKVIAAVMNCSAIICFFSRHHQNGMHYFKSMEIPENGNFVRTLKNLSATRWIADWQSIKTVGKEITRIIKCLIVLRKDGDPKISSTSKSLLVNILDFELMFGLFLLKIILPITSKLSSYIQSTTIDKGNSWIMQNWPQILQKVIGTSWLC